MGVDLLLHHRHHVEGVAHGVEAQDAGKLLETGPGGVRWGLDGFNPLLFSFNYHYYYYLFTRC